MSKPHIHARKSADRFGGQPEEYLDIHQFLDSSKAALCDNRHRALTHNSWFLVNVVERVFGVTMRNSDGREVSTREVAEWHVYEDYGFIPSASDFLQEIGWQEWMNNGKGPPPPSRRNLTRTAKDPD